MRDPDPGDKKEPYPRSAELLYGHATLGDSRKVNRSVLDLDP